METNSHIEKGLIFMMVLFSICDFFIKQAKAAPEHKCWSSFFFELRGVKTCIFIRATVSLTSCPRKTLRFGNAHKKAARDGCVTILHLTESLPAVYARSL
jgi:hypothetical protein